MIYSIIRKSDGGDHPHHCRNSFEGQKDALKLLMDEPDCVFCRYGYSGEKK